MTRKTFKIILAVLLASFLLPGMALGATGYELAETKSGLVIRSPDPEAMIGNLNPGDQKDSRLELTNEGSSTLTVYIRTVITDEDTLPGGSHLADVMNLTIQNGSNTLTDTAFRKADKIGNVKIGTMAPGATRTLEFHTDLPGKETGNAYQGATMKVKWIFTTVSSGGGGGGHYTVQEQPPEEIIIPEEPDVVTPQEPDEEITVPVITDPKMPGTGVGSPIPYYAVGSAAVIAGFILTGKKKKE